MFICPQCEREHECGYGFSWAICSDHQAANEQKIKLHQPNLDAGREYVDKIVDAGHSTKLINVDRADYFFWLGAQRRIAELT